MTRPVDVTRPAQGFDRPATSANQSMRAPAPMLFRTRIDHVRTAPLRNTFSYTSSSWFVDLDDLPTMPRVLRSFIAFAAADHLGDPHRSIRQNVDAFLALHGIDLHGGRITMLANARVFGRTFNPLSVFWCHDDAERLVCVIAEVHNTYGERHSYLIRTDSRGSAVTDKEFYVSPFNDVEGTYRMRLPEPASALRLSIVLDRDQQPPFVARVTGSHVQVSTKSIFRTMAAPARVVALIKWQGIRLWARGLPIRPRPEHEQQEAAQ